MKFKLLVGLVLMISVVQAQYQTKSYGVREGLPSPETYMIHQDYKGYIWICTDRGVSRYDGYTFTNYNTNHGLTHNTVFKVVEDKQHRLWFNCYDGSVCIYDYKRESFVPFWGNDIVKRTLKPRGWVGEILSDTEKQLLRLTEVFNYDSVMMFNLNDSSFFKEPLQSSTCLSSDYFSLEFDNTDPLSVKISQNRANADYPDHHCFIPDDSVGFVSVFHAGREKVCCRPGAIVIYKFFGYNNHSIGLLCNFSH